MSDERIARREIAILDSPDRATPIITYKFAARPPTNKQTPIPSVAGQ